MSNDAPMSNCVQLSDFMSLPCGFCFLQIAKRDLPAHVRECPARLARIAHPSNRRTWA